MDYKSIFLLLYGLALINSFVSFFFIKNFLNSHPTISNLMDLKEFKNLVRMQMYQTLAQIGFLGIGSIMAFMGIYNDTIGLGIIVLANGIVFGLGHFLKDNEKAVKSMRVNDNKLINEYKDICLKWEKNPFPDF